MPIASYPSASNDTCPCFRVSISRRASFVAIRNIHARKEFSSLKLLKERKTLTNASCVASCASSWANMPIYRFLIFLHQEPKTFFGLRANSLYDVFVFNVHTTYSFFFPFMTILIGLFLLAAKASSSASAIAFVKPVILLYWETLSDLLPFK